MKEAIGIGATPQLALEEACRQLGKETYEVEFELLEEPKAKLFGLFGGRPAKVRAYCADEAPAARPQPVPAASPAQPKPTPKPAEAPTPAPAPADVPVEASVASPSGAAVAAAEYLKKVLAGLGATQIDVEIHEYDSGAELTITGADAGVVIGHHGETLSALQYLVGLVANHVQESYYRITLNTGNYREKREQTLIRLAQRMAHKAVNSGRRQQLEPMNPYERRIIHTAVQEVEGATSWSEGVDLNRHVVIGPADGARPPRPNRRGNGRRPNPNGRGGNRPPRTGNRPRPTQSQPVGAISDVAVKSHPPVEVPASPAPAPKPKKESGAVPLYGRIDVK